MAVLVRKKVSCPYCGYVLKYDVRVNQPDYGGTSIGGKYATCPKCKKKTSDAHYEFNEIFLKTIKN